MTSLQEDRTAGMQIPVETGWLLASCMEARGKQDLWTRQKPEVLKALRDHAIVQSVESSNRIEGVTIDARRLRPLVLGRARPQDRPEEEIAGYKKALDWIFASRKPIEISPKTILELHLLAQGGMSGDAGKWKSKDNEIIEIRPDGERVVRFVPTGAKETPGAVGNLCREYLEAVERKTLPELLLIGAFVLDFLCIHPFRDGNGRVARLLTTLLLEKDGFAVVRFISLERLIEQNRESYYRSLHQSSRGWHESTHDIVPWWNFFLFIIDRAYREFAEAVEAREAGPGKTELIRETVIALEGEFSLGQIRAQIPSVSEQLIKRVLQQLKAEGRLRLTGHGRSARWAKVD